MYAAFAVSGIVLGAAYLLWLYQRVMFGKLDKEENKSLADLTSRENATLVPIVALCIFIGVYPKPFLEKLAVPVAAIVERVSPRARRPRRRRRCRPRSRKSSGTPPPFRATTEPALFRSPAAGDFRP